MKHRLFQTLTGQFVLMQHDDGSIRTSWLTPQVRRLLAKSREDRRLLPELSAKLNDYFAGKPVEFTDIALAAGGEFYRRCWRACRRIPRGETRTYAQLAKLAGSPAAARAAGQAMRNNPMPIITPCHRVIGSTGKLHGFGGSLDASGKELAIKNALLEMEGALADQTKAQSRTTRTSTASKSRRSRGELVLSS